jgi:predicted  nucleic acid-binding Zn-ribbon protein
MGMPSIKDQPRLIARCEACGSVYAAVEMPNGRIAPIGRLEGCKCGSSDFSEYESE